MIFKKIGLFSSLICWSLFIVLNEADFITENNSTKLKLKPVTDMLDECYRKCSQDGGHWVFISDDGDDTGTSICNPVCRTLVGVSRGTFCPVPKQYRNPNTILPRNCKEIQDKGQHISGVYEIFPNNQNRSLVVLCDMETNGGGWTYIQKRFDGSEDFTRNYREYTVGFGNLGSEFWIGLENIYQLTGFGNNELLVEFTNKDQEQFHAQYKRFSIGSGVDGYVLKSASGFSGDVIDAMHAHVGYPFSTYDLDQDSYQSGNCAKDTGGWWFYSCFNSNLNGKLRNMKRMDSNKYIGMSWKQTDNDKYFLLGSKMLVRPTSQ